jgi:predicted RecA/RadA family phage recombinase
MVENRHAEHPGDSPRSGPQEMTLRHGVYSIRAAKGRSLKHPQPITLPRVPSLEKEDCRAMKNWIGEGRAIDVTLASVSKSGDGVLVGGLFGIAGFDGDVGDTIAAWTEGAFTLPKLNTETWNVDDVIYWDTGNARATNATASGVTQKIGVAIATAANPSIVGAVRLVPII